MLYTIDQVKNALAQPRSDSVVHSLKEYTNGRGPYILQYVHEKGRDFMRRALLAPSWSKFINFSFRKPESVTAREEDIVETHELSKSGLYTLKPLALSVFADYHAQLFGVEQHLDVPELIHKYSHHLNGPETSGVANMTTKSDWRSLNEDRKISLILTNAEWAALAITDYKTRHSDQMDRASKRYRYDRGERRFLGK